MAKHTTFANIDECHTVLEFNRMTIDLPWNIKTSAIEKSIEQVQTIDQKHFSIKGMNAQINGIPKYLMKQYLPFQQLLNRTQPTTKEINSKRVQDNLIEIIILIYKVMVIQTYHYLWTTYFKSGTGQLLNGIQQVESICTLNHSMWPKQVKSMLSLKNIDKIEDTRICINFINKHLHKLDCQLKEFKFQLNTKANQYPDYSLTIQNIIVKYIEKYLESFRMNIEHQIEILHYDYRIRALKLESLQHHPNEYQVMKEICQTKYVLELIEQEYQLMQQQINHYNSPMPQSELINSIQNVDIREQFLSQYNEIILQSKTKLFQMYQKAMKEEKDEYTKKYNDLVRTMWSNYHSSDSNQNISQTMVQLIDKRCQIISERLQCIYKFKIQQILVQRSTTSNESVSL